MVKDSFDFRDVYLLVQARMRSSRFPGKVLKKIHDKTLLENVLFGFPRDRVLVLTTTEPEDQPLREFCASHEIQFFEGPESDVFERFHRAIQKFEAKYYIRITGDNPCLYRESLPMMISLLREEDLDYSVGHELPIGGAAEAFTRQSFLQQSQLERSAQQVEHVTAKYYSPDSSFHWKPVNCGYGHLRKLRLTIDTPEDLSMFQALSRVMNTDPCTLSYESIEKILSHSGDILELNRGVRQRTVYDVESKR
ncbi:hypothetical protein HOF92_05960 [bacterium]|jgi:spore coat polysaccharide biosynthesis protein SpsF|nr:hypothetical protein [bacterium]